MGKKKNKIIAKQSPAYSSTQITKGKDKRKRVEKFRDIALQPDNEGESEYIDSKTTKKILRAFAKQKSELQLNIDGNQPSTQSVKPTVTFQQNVEGSDDSDSDLLSDTGDENHEFEAFEKTLAMSKADEEAFMRFQKG